MIKKISCCGCYFDKVYYILNSNYSFNYETFENGFDWVFRDFISGFIILICDNIFSEHLFVTIYMNLNCQNEILYLQLFL